MDGILALMLRFAVPQTFAKVWPGIFENSACGSLPRQHCIDT